MKRIVALALVLAAGRILMASTKTQSTAARVDSLVTRVAALENGTGFKAGLTLHGNLNMSGNNITNPGNVGGAHWPVGAGNSADRDTDGSDTWDNNGRHVFNNLVDNVNNLRSQMKASGLFN